MANLIYKLNKKKKHGYHLAVFIAMPTILLTVALFFMITYNYSNALETTEEHTALILNKLYNESEAKLQNLIKTVGLIDGNETIHRALTDENYVYENNLAIELHSINRSYDFVDNVFIFSKTADLIYTQQGCHSAYDFFENINIYGEYNLAYWRGIPFIRDESYRILLPTILKTTSGSETVIPVVLRRISGTAQKNLMIANVNLSKLISGQTAEYLTKNTSIYMLNKITGDIFDRNGKLMPKEAFPESFIENIFNSASTSFESRLNEKKVFVPYYSASRSLSSYAYFAVIPGGDISQQILPSVLFSLSIVIIFLIFAFLLAVRNASYIINPLKDIVNAFTQNNDEHISGNLLEDAKNLALSSINTSEELTRLIPYAQEKYLSSLLYSTEYSIDDDVAKKLLSGINFPHKLFAVVILQIVPTSKLFDIYSSDEYYSIQRGIHSIIKDIFSDSFTNYILPAENGILQIILNLRDNDSMDQVNYILNNISSYLKNDMDAIDLFIGKSDICDDISGIKQCFREAQSDFSPYNPFPSHILASGTDSVVDFSDEDESSLLRSLLAFDSENTYELLSGIFIKNKYLSEQSAKKLYNMILNVVIKVMRIRNIPHKTKKLDFEVISDCLNQPLERAYQDMMHLINYTLGFSEKLIQSKLTHIEIIDFIDKNYHLPELSLDYLADNFHVSPSNVSMIVKNITGFGFREYLSNLRVERASYLLTHTDQNIQEICDTCGFNSIKTFYRIFKNATNMTPKKYRQDGKNINKNH